MPRPLLFSPLPLRDVTLKNRVVIAPMHQYSGKEGFPTDWHLMNAGRWAAGGAGLVIVESTKVERRGCGTVGDLGLWKDDFVPAFRRLADFIRDQGAIPGIQLGHSGRKARRLRPWEGGGRLLAANAETYDWDGWELVSSSGPSDARDNETRALETEEVAALADAWGQAARRADEAGFDVLEIHGAHGYLIHQFLSPQINDRSDRYGGSPENRRRFALEVVERVREHWPAAKPLFLRLSVEDNRGWGVADSVALARAVAQLGVDVVDCSSGGIAGGPQMGGGTYGYGYQVPYAEALRRDGGVMSMAVGLIVHAEQAEAILQEGRADLIAIAREALFNPNWPMDAALKLGVEDAFALLPDPYRYWLEKRAESIESLTPSTFRPGADGREAAE